VKKDSEKKYIEYVLRQEIEASIADRVNRCIQIKPHSIIPGTYFAPVSAEVTSLFRDGHYYGCIALAQAVAEALVRFLCQKNGFQPEKTFENNVKKLSKRGFISDDIKGFFLRIWEKRDDYHHLNNTIEQDRLKLKNYALDKVRILADTEKEIFSYTDVNGVIHPKYPKYWNIIDNQATVYLRLDP